MAGAHTTQADALSTGVLGIIGAYGMGSALDAQDLFATRTSAVAGPLPALADSQEDPGGRVRLL